MNPAAMTTSSYPTSMAPKELLQHSSWLRRLAREILNDASLADDVVQRTWLAALRRPPRESGEET